MRVIEVGKAYAEKRIDKVIREAFPRMPISAMYKAFRKKDIKANGIRIKDDYVTSEGDRLEIYIADPILDGKAAENGEGPDKGFTVVYEDANILLVNKEQGISVHADREQGGSTLIEHVQAYLKDKGEYFPQAPHAFPPSLCHRLDRNTGGLLLIAKNEPSLKVLLDKIKNREVKKYYQCLVAGKMEKPSANLRAYLIKDEYKSRVFVSDTPKRNSLEIITNYRVLSYDNNISRLEVELVTGRTHQIRAHLAHIGHPIIGDGKYGTNAINRPLKAKHQALWAYKINFQFSESGGILEYLRGESFEVEPHWKLS